MFNFFKRYFRWNMSYGEYEFGGKKFLLKYEKRRGKIRNAKLYKFSDGCWICIKEFEKEV